MPVAINVGTSIGSENKLDIRNARGLSNVGHLATTFRPDGTLWHEPFNDGELETHNGALSTTHDGQVIRGLKITGDLDIQHANVVVEDCELLSGFELDARSDPSRSVLVRWCTLGNLNGVRLEGNPQKTNHANGYANYTVYRCEVYGFTDFFFLWGSNVRIVENWMHSLAWHQHDASQPPYDGSGDSHCDAVQFQVGGGRGPINGTIIQGNHYELWQFDIEAGQKVGDNWGVLSNSVEGPGSRATSGLAIIQNRGDQNGPVSNTTIRGNFIGGNYSHLLYNQAISGETVAPTNTVIVGNVLRADRPKYSYHSSVSGDPLVLRSGGSAVYWGSNLDRASGATISVPSGCTQAGAPSNYPEVDTATLGGNPGGGTVNLVITSPANDSVHLTGTITFVGGVGEGDAFTNYRWFHFYLERTLDDGLIERYYLDRDGPDFVNGTTITASEDGPSFTDRVKGPVSLPADDFKLVMVGERLDDTEPFASVNVTIGDTEVVVGEDPLVSFSAEVTMDAIVDVDTSVGGVPANLVRARPKERFVKSYQVQHYRSDTGAIVKFNGTIWVEV